MVFACLLAGERAAGTVRSGGMTRRVHLTGQIKPATREAVLDQLAAIADGIIRERSRWWNRMWLRFERWWQV